MITGMRPPAYNDNIKRRAVNPPSKYYPTISKKLDRCILWMIELKPENGFQSIWDLIFEIETLPDYYS
jgi:hypothetical protein